MLSTTAEKKMMMMHKRKSERGVSVVEILITFAVMATLTAIAVPQLLSYRRLVRASGINRQISTSLRLARQLSMSQAGATPTGALARVAYTFQYDNNTKEVRVIGPIASGTASLIDPSYPNIAGSAVVSRTLLTEGGLSAAEIMYGIPSGPDLPNGAPIIPTGALGDGVSMTALTNNQLNITFQPDGSVINSTNTLVDRALFLYNGRAAQDTASAISILGSSGRVKVWRYGSNANAYAE